MENRWWLIFSSLLAIQLAACSGGGGNKSDTTATDQSVAETQIDQVTPPDSSPDAGPDVQPDLHSADVQPDIGPDLVADTNDVTGSDVTPDLSPSDTTDVTQDAGDDVIADLHADVAAETETHSGCDDNIASDENTVVSANPLVLGQKVAQTGSLAICPAGQHDWFKLVVGQNDPLGHYVLDFAGTSGPAGYALHIAAKVGSPTGDAAVVVGENVTLTAQTKIALLAVTAPGTYYISVTAINLADNKKPVQLAAYNFVPGAPCQNDAAGDALCQAVWPFLPNMKCQSGYCAECATDNECVNSSCLLDYSVCGCLLANGNDDCSNGKTCTDLFSKPNGVCQ